MTNLEIAAIVIGILIVVTRSTAVIWPKKSLSFLKKISSTKSSIQTLGVIVILISLLFIYYIKDEISLLQMLISGHFIAISIFSIMVIIFPKVLATILKTFDSNLNLLRQLASIAVLVGFLLIYLGLR